jgi:hypothetical protein
MVNGCGSGFWEETMFDSLKDRCATVAIILAAGAAASACSVAADIRSASPLPGLRSSNSIDFERPELEPLAVALAMQEHRRNAGLDQRSKALDPLEQSLSASPLVTATEDAPASGEVLVASFSDRQALRSSSGQVNMEFLLREGARNAALDVRNLQSAGVIPGIDASALRGVDDPRFWEQRLSSPQEVSSPNSRISLGYSIVSPASGGGLELDVAPKASVVFSDEMSGGGAGAFVRIGQNLRRERSSTEAQGWYFYAGADAQALSYKFDGDNASITDGMRVEDKLLVGDAQLGLALRKGEGEFALGVTHREVKYEGQLRESQSRNESYLSLSYSLKK